MSHFSSMAARYVNVQQLIDALVAMGVPVGEISVHPSVGTFEGTKVLESERPVRSSEWGSTRNDGKSTQSCSILVSEDGMQAMAKQAEVSGTGLKRSQHAELGFYDCGCDPNVPTYVMDTDTYESGPAIAGYVTAMYQLQGIKADKSLEASKVEQDEDGNFRIVVRKKPEQKTRSRHGGVGSRMKALVGGGRSRR